MTELNENRGRAGGSIKSLWTADEAKLVKHFLNTFQIRQWDFPYTYVDRSDPEGEWILNVPRAVSLYGSSSLFLSTGGDGPGFVDIAFGSSENSNASVLEADTAAPFDKITINVTAWYTVILNVNGILAQPTGTPATISMRLLRDPGGAEIMPWVRLVLDEAKLDAANPVDLWSTLHREKDMQLTAGDSIKAQVAATDASFTDAQVTVRYLHP